MHKKNSSSLTFISFMIVFIVFLMFLLLFAFGCEGTRMLYIKVQNNTSETLTLTINEGLEHNITPGGTKSVPVPAIYSKFLIEAKNGQGNIAYSRSFGWQELHDMKWKITITQLEIGPQSSDNLTGVALLRLYST